LPDVIPLQISGTFDTDLSNVSANNMMQWGLANLWEEGEEGGYAVRHGRCLVNDFGRPRQELSMKMENDQIFLRRRFCVYFLMELEVSKQIGQFLWISMTI
jgi:hypothetical protein